MNTGFIFIHTSYREVIKDFISRKKELNPSFSLGVMTQHLKGISKSSLSMILSSKRNLSVKHIFQMAKRMGLKDKESKYFEALVFFNDNKETETRNIYFQKMLRLRPNNVEANIEIKHYRILESWYPLAIHEYLKRSKALPTVDSLYTTFRAQVSKEEIRKSLDALIETGMIEVLNNESKEIRIKNKVLKSGDETRSKAIQSYHASCLEQGKKSLEQDDVSEREFGSVNICLTKDKFQETKKLIKEFRDNLLKIGQSDESDSVIAQINIQMFKLTE